MAEPTIAIHLKAATEGFKKGFKGASGILKGFGDVLKGVGVIAAGQMIANAFTRLIHLVTSLGKGIVLSAARVQEMQGVLYNLGEMQGYARKQMDGFVQSVVKAGIRTDVAQNLVAQFTRAEFDLADAAGVARVAQDAAVLSMIDSSEALSRITYGIMTHNVLVLRTAGLTISAARAYDEYAKTVDKTAAQLTEAEKTQAMMNAVMKEGEAIAGTYETAMLAPGKLLRSMPRLFYEIGVEMGKSFLKPFGEALWLTKEFTEALKTAVSEGGSLAPALKKLGEMAATLVKGLAEWGKVWLEKLPKTTEEVQELSAVVQDTGDIIVRGAADVAGAFNVVLAILKALLGQIEVLAASVAVPMGVMIASTRAVILGLEGVAAAMRGDFQAAREYGEAVRTIFGQVTDAIGGFFGEIGERQKGVIADVKYALEDAFGEGQQAVTRRFWRTAAEEAEQAAQDMARAIKAAAADIEITQQAMAEAIKATNLEAQQKIAEITIRETWRAIDEQLAAQRQLIDEERATAKHRAQIQQQFADAMTQAQGQYSLAIAQAAKDRGERLAEIEREYQKRIRDIQRNFQQSEQEAIRNRDALALVEAERQRDRELQEAQEARDEQNADAQNQYQKQLDQARLALQQQEEAARENLRKQQEELAAALVEKAEEQRLADQRAAEDADRARAREMGAIRTQQGQELAEAITAHRAEFTELQTHHQQLLAEHTRHLTEVSHLRRAMYLPGPMPGGGTTVVPPWLMQYGGSGIVTSPTLFMAGEAGPEKYSFTPLGGGARASARVDAGGSRVTIYQTQNNTFGGSINADQMAKLREMMREVTKEGIGEMLPGD